MTEQERRRRQRIVDEARQTCERLADMEHRSVLAGPEPEDWRMKPRWDPPVQREKRLDTEREPLRCEIVAEFRSEQDADQHLSRLLRRMLKAERTHMLNTVGEERDIALAVVDERLDELQAEMRREVDELRALQRDARALQRELRAALDILRSDMRARGIDPTPTPPTPLRHIN